jgi:hypothetical protein
MSAAAQPQIRGLAPTLLVAHVHRLGLGFDDHPSALDRLQQAVGQELALRLLHALAGDHASRPARALAHSH